MGNEVLHSGHRERMRERWAKYGGEQFEDHELLEMLLYYALPRCNTNELAHVLMETFGSLNAVLEANEDELSAVSGMGMQSAHLVALAGEAARRYAAAYFGETKNAPILRNVREVVEFLRPRFIGASKEYVYLLLFDSSMRLLDCHMMGVGSISQVVFPIREVLLRADRKHAVAAILAHNHPHGLAVASPEDLQATRYVADALRYMQVNLLEHIVLNETAYMPIIKNSRKSHNRDADPSLLGDVLRQRIEGIAWEADNEAE